MEAQAGSAFPSEQRDLRRPSRPAQAGSFPNGGAGTCCYFGGGPSGGFGGGGGTGYDGGGGGGGAPGGSGQCGYSYVTKTGKRLRNYRWQYEPLHRRRLRGDRLCVDQLRRGPEPSTWAMMLAGFAGLGWLARLRRRKLTPV